MHGKIDTDKLVAWDLRKSYSADELGIEPDMWDYVMKDGSLKTLEDLEDICTRIFDKMNKPTLIFGKVYPASEITREVAWDDWNNYLKDTLANMCVEGITRRIN